MDDGRDQTVVDYDPMRTVFLRMPESEKQELVEDMQAAGGRSLNQFCRERLRRKPERPSTDG